MPSSNLYNLKQGGERKPPTQIIAGATGAIRIREGVVILARSGGVAAATIAAPIAGRDDGKRLVIVAGTAQAHTVTLTGGFNGAGTGSDVATFGGAVGDALEVVAYGGNWLTVSARNVTLA